MFEILLRISDCFWSILPQKFFLCVSPVGSWVCILICGLILLISHYRFEKLFSRRFWLVGLILFAGTYLLFFIPCIIAYTYEVFACYGGEIFEGEEIFEYFFSQFFLGEFLFFFTIAYLISFICRLIKSGREKNKKEGGDESCRTS